MFLSQTLILLSEAHHIEVSGIVIRISERFISDEGIHSILLFVIFNELVELLVILLGTLKLVVPVAVLRQGAEVSFH